jgi:hypothetical protein
LVTAVLQVYLWERICDKEISMDTS